MLVVSATGWLAWTAWKPAQGKELAAAGALHDGSIAAAYFPAVRVPPSVLAYGTAAANPPRGTASGAVQAQEESFEICGLGRVSQRELENGNPLLMAKAALAAQALERRKDTALSRLSARLAAGPDRDQVAARLLMGDAQGAALIAARSTDATAYRLALMSCWKSPDASNCQALTTQAWARLDAEDARPWLYLMGEAMRRPDEASATEALEQVLQRRKLSPSRALVPSIDGAGASVGDAVGLGLAILDVIGREAAMPDPSGMGMLRYCSAEALKSGSRRPRCERLARWLFEHADSVMDGLVAVRIADGVGMPAGQRPYAREQLNEGLRRLADESMQDLGMSCAGIARAAEWPARAARRSELQQALQAAAAAP